MTATFVSQDQNKERPVRASASHTPKWQRYQQAFIPSDCGGVNKGQKSTSNSLSSSSKEHETYAYQKQYSHVYSQRLARLKDRCWDALRRPPSPDDRARAFGSDGSSTTPKEVNRVLELQEDVVSRIVGTLVKEVNDPDEETVLAKDQNHTHNDCRPSDQLFLEDESGRVALSLDEDFGRHHHHVVHEFCTGFVAGVEGVVDATGTLHVRRIVSPAPAPASMSGKSTSSNNNSTSGGLKLSEPSGLDPHVLLISSLQCGDPSVGTIPREMLISYLQGHFTDDAAKVCRVVLAGSGSCPTNPLEGLKELDLVLGKQISGAVSRGGCSIPVDVIPSKDDPTTTNWPQRPIHSSLLPSCSKPMVYCTPNPYAAHLGGNQQLVVGTDGLNVRDLRRHVLTSVSTTTVAAKAGDGDEQPSDTPTQPLPSSSASFRPLTELEALERTLVWSNICPTAPASIGSVPTADFVLDETPRLYFCGNCDEGFATKLSLPSFSSTATSTAVTRLVCVPKFHQTGEAVLVNLRNLDVELLRFNDDVPEGSA